MVLCVVVLVVTLSQTPRLGIVKIFDSWPVWDNDSDRAKYNRVPIFAMWDHCKRPNLADTAKSQCDLTVNEYELSLVLVLFFTQFCTATSHTVQYLLCSTKSPTFKDLSKRGIKLVFWIEYTFSASFIAVVTSYFSGNVDYKSLLLILSSQSTLMLIGLLIDILRYLKDVIDKNTDITFREMLGSDLMLLICNPYQAYKEGFGRDNGDEGEGGHRLVISIANRCCSVDSYTALMLFIFTVGFFNLLCQWLPGFFKVIDSIGTGMPDWIVVLYLTEFALYSSFGFVQFAFTLKWRARTDMLREHNIHTRLSFASKFTLVLFFIMYFVRNADDRNVGGIVNASAPIAAS